MTQRFYCLPMTFLLTVFGVLGPVAWAQDTVKCVRGLPDAPIRIEVFSDFECPACRAFYLQTMRRVFSEYADQGRACVVYREFPGFAHSREAASYARAALRLGVEQWGRVADALFEAQARWSQSGDLESVVTSVLSAGDMAAVREHMTDPLIDAVIDDDAILGLELRVTSTPTFFIKANGRTEKVEAALTYGAMQRRLEASLDE